MPSLILKNQKVNYVVKKSAALKRLRLSIEPDSGLVIITVPKLIPSIFAMQFLKINADWVLRRLKTIESLPPMPWSGHSRNDYLHYKKPARILVEERLSYYNGLYGFDYGRIAIKDQRTKWGSCSRRKNLNFNYRIALLPLPLADYIIVHELCHLGRLNHSREFWLLVERALPDFRERRKSLKSYYF